MDLSVQNTSGSQSVKSQTASHPNEVSIKKIRRFGIWDSLAAKLADPNQTKSTQQKYKNETVGTPIINKFIGRNDFDVVLEIIKIEFQCTGELYAWIQSY